MAIDSLVTAIGATAGPARVASNATSATDGARFAEALASAHSPSVAGLQGTPGQPVREVQGATTRAGTGFGHQLLDSIEHLYRTSESLRPSATAAASSAGASPVARSAAVAPGPAAAYLAPQASGARPPAALKAEGAEFDGMLRSLEHVYTHAIQVSVVTKTTGSFTASMNKLMSSA